ncbi:MAG: nitroreductase family protein [Fimbriimonadaceae bacterium]
MPHQYRGEPYQHREVSQSDGAKQLKDDLEIARQRRSIRHFSDQTVPREMIEDIIRIAATAPSGANKQPWYFVAISSKYIKRQIREAAENEEKTFYETKITPEWRADLKHLGTDFVKEHITDAPWLIVVFRQDYELTETGERKKNYYMTESVGIAVGFLIQALHRAGLCTLTHTPAPMTFLRDICKRPLNEKPFVILPVGYPAEDCEVPVITKKSLEEVSDFL